MLSAWWSSGADGRARVLRHMLGRADAALAILEKLDLLNRFSESARLCVLATLLAHAGTAPSPLTRNEGVVSLVSGFSCAQEPSTT